MGHMNAFVLFQHVFGKWLQSFSCSERQGNILYLKQWYCSNEPKEECAQRLLPVMAPKQIQGGGGGGIMLAAKGRTHVVCCVAEFT
jgi:hypothetical protein